MCIDGLISQLLELLDSKLSRICVDDGSGSDRQAHIRLERMLDDLNIICESSLKLRKFICVYKKRLDVGVQYHELDSSVMKSIELELFDCEKSIALLHTITKKLDEQKEQERQELELTAGGINNTQKFELATLIHEINKNSKITLALPTFNSLETQQYQLFNDLNNKISPINASIMLIPQTIEQYSELAKDTYSESILKLIEKYEFMIADLKKINDCVRELRVSLVDLKWIEIFKFLVGDVKRLVLELESCGSGVGSGSCGSDDDTETLVDGDDADTEVDVSEDGSGNKFKDLESQRQCLKLLESAFDILKRGVGENLIHDSELIQLKDELYEKFRILTKKMKKLKKKAKKRQQKYGSTVSLSGLSRMRSLSNETSSSSDGGDSSDGLTSEESSRVPSSSSATSSSDLNSPMYEGAGVMGTPIDYSSVKNMTSPSTLVRSSTSSASSGARVGSAGYPTVGRKRRSLSLNLKTVMIEEFPMSARKDGSFANFKILQDKNTSLNSGDMAAHLKHERRKSNPLFQKLVGEEAASAGAGADSAARRHSVAVGFSAGNGPHRSVSNKENSGVALPSPPSSSPLKEINLASRAEFKLFSQVDGKSSHMESVKNNDDFKDSNNDNNIKDNNNGNDYSSTSSSPINLKIKMNSPNPFVTPSKHLHSQSHDYDDDEDDRDEPTSPVSMHVSNKQLKYVPLPLNSLKEKIEKFNKEKSTLLSLEEASKVEVGHDIDTVVEESQKYQKSAFSSGCTSPTTVMPDSSPLKDYNLDCQQQMTSISASSSAPTSTSSSKRSSKIPLPTRIESRLSLLRSLTTLGDLQYQDDQYNSIPYDPLNPTHRRKSVPASFPHYSTITYPPASVSNNNAIPSRLEQLGSSLACQNDTKLPLPSGIPRSATGHRASGRTRFASSAPASSRSSIMYGNSPNRRTYGSNRSTMLSGSSNNRSSKVSGAENGTDFYPNHARSGSSLLDSEKAKKSTYGDLYGRNNRLTGSHTGATCSSYGASSQSSVGGRPTSSTSARTSSPASKLAVPTSINVIKNRARDRSSRASLASRNGIVPLTTFEVDGKTVIRGGGAVRSDRMRSISG
ncbi:unnamed protein product [Ambrosiozyma monospora]|uniref:Unnamed protein product n=1 Tax=Ambrosiozyma monospora TaxID=43982 RepID=A0A9W6YTJ7_AMBMO|nr:unnamed protein product [Ambrosiozyma monospora]